jgi:hypothetical protein
MVALVASTTKKVLVQRFDREPLTGFVHPQTYVTAQGIEMLDLYGKHAVVPFSEVKTVSFVRDFQAADPGRERRLFSSRPKMEGLWIRMQLRDGESMDGLLPNNLLLLEPYGFTVTPPDPSSNNQRVFVPRAAVESVQVLGVVGSPLKRRPKAAPTGARERQIEMFDEAASQDRHTGPAR